MKFNFDLIRDILMVCYEKQKTENVNVFKGSYIVQELLFKYEDTLLTSEIERHLDEMARCGLIVVRTFGSEKVKEIESITEKGYDFISNIYSIKVFHTIKENMIKYHNHSLDTFVDVARECAVQNIIESIKKSID